MEGVQSEEPEFGWSKEFPYGQHGCSGYYPGSSYYDSSHIGISSNSYKLYAAASRWGAPYRIPSYWT